MRMHNRSMFRKYVRNADIGETAVKEIWHGDTMIYPDNETLVKKIQLEVPAEGTLEWTYWVHAVRGVTLDTDIYNKKAQMGFSIGSDSWWCGDNRPTKLPSATLTEEGLLTFKEEEGPPASDLQKGDYITLTASIPSTCDTVYQCWVEDATGSIEWTNPWLEGTYLKLQYGKGRKKECAAITYTVKGVPSGHAHLHGSCYQQGHGRGDRWSWAFPTYIAAGQQWVYCTDGKYKEGDTGMHGWFQQRSGCTYAYLSLYYPSFNKEFRLKVKSVQIQSSSD